ncbi:hypothetical protein [Bremerella sp. P1]|uniref:hypothetical protein n=1 Tax=Bremerella sp. P1 TaxID=3026424 RepID=UPI0023684136|nr:hypothetical protein [Bremerella sp. P1]WDI42529.1 hypothetical protein PSR63_01040 [Bremerella sp. P1]
MPPISDSNHAQVSETDSQRAQLAANLAYLVVQANRRDQQDVDSSSNNVETPEN